MSIILRLAFVIAGSIVLGSCARAVTAISGDSHPLISAEPLSSEFVVTARSSDGSKTEPVSLTPMTSIGGNEKQYLGYVLIDSAKKCQEFSDRLSAVQRGVDTSFDILTGVLSALATALTPLGTVHALTAAATISTGTKTAIDANVYAKATAALILQEVNRTYYLHIRDYRNRLLTISDVSQIIPALEVSEIEAIHRECSLDSAIASLSQTGIVSATAIGAATGAAAGATAAAEKNLPVTTGALAGAVAGATAGAAAAGAPTASQAAATAGAAAGAKAAAEPATAGTVAPPLPSPGSTGQTRPAGPGVGKPLEPRNILPPPPPPPPPSTLIPGAQGEAERKLLLPLGKYIQSVLCLTPEQQTGDFGQQATRDAIQSWRSAITPNPQTGPLSAREIRVLEGVTGSCDAQYKSAYERFAFPTPEDIRRLQRSLAAALSNNVPPVAVPSFEATGKLDGPTRDAIRAFQRLKGLPETGIMTRQLRDTMVV
jgi:hypothetical protein